MVHDKNTFFQLGRPAGLEISNKYIWPRAKLFKLEIWRDI
jgi:hypothetical protein